MKILVIRFKQIGDAILSSVILKSLKKTYPNAEIDYVLYENVAPLFENQKYVNEVITITNEERKNIFKYIKKVWKITRTKYDIIIDIMSTPKSELFTLLSPKALYKIGRSKPKRGFTYTHKIREPQGDYDKPEKFLKMLEVLEKDGTKVVYDKNYTLTFSDEEKFIMKEKMKQAGVDFNKIIVPLAINSRRPEKVYPIEFMKEIAIEILNRYDAQIILYYSPNEKEFAKKFHKSLEWDKRVISDINTKNIRELGVLLTLSDIFIGNEGGPRHLSEAVDTPSIGIFRLGGEKKQWLTKNKERHIGIEPKDVLDSIKLKDLTKEQAYKVMTPKIILNLIENHMKFVSKLYKKNR